MAAEESYSSSMMIVHVLISIIIIVIIIVVVVVSSLRCSLAEDGRTPGGNDVVSPAGRYSRAVLLVRASSDRFRSDRAVSTFKPALRMGRPPSLNLREMTSIHRSRYDGPSGAGPWILWQQPHPIAFAVNMSKT
jgi:hypothetical protein